MPGRAAASQVRAACHTPIYIYIIKVWEPFKHIESRILCHYLNGRNVFQCFPEANKLKQNFIWRGKWLPISHEGVSQGIQPPLPPSSSSLFLSCRNKSCCSLLKGRSKERELTRGRAARRRAARRSACMLPGPAAHPEMGGQCAQRPPHKAPLCLLSRRTHTSTSHATDLVLTVSDSAFAFTHLF